jgi:hypothetical protein
VGWAFGTAFAYVDDVLNCSMGSREEHIALVDVVMASFAKFDFTFKLSKTELYKSEVDFLGHSTIWFPRSTWTLLVFMGYPLP